MSTWTPIAGTTPDLGSLGLLFREAPAAMSLTRVHDGVFLDASERMAELLGYARDELIGQSVHKLGIWREPPHADAQRQLAATGRARDVQLTYHHKDGSKRHLVASLEMTPTDDGPAILAVSVDVTQLKQAEETRARLVAAIESADDAIMTIDTRARFLTWNKGAERLFGFTKEEILGSDGQALIPPELASETKLLADELRAHGVIRDHETKRRRKDGTDVDVSVTINLVRDATDAVIGYTGVMRDISQRKRVEEESRRQLVARKLVRRILRVLSEQGAASQTPRRSLGRTLATEVATDSMEHALDAFRAMGVGALALAERAGDSYTFHGEDLLEVTSGVAAPTCQIALGFLEAMVGQLHGASALGSELKCQSQGHAKCQFVVKARMPASVTDASRAPQAP